MYQSRNRLVRQHNARVQQERTQEQNAKQAQKEKVKHVAAGAVIGAAAVLVLPELGEQLVYALVEFEKDLIRENTTRSFYTGPID